MVDQPVSGNGNNFGGGSMADQEIALDLQIMAGLLPKRKIVVYFAGNTTQSLVGAIKQAIFDDVNEPQVLSVSWGSAETFWTRCRRAMRCSRRWPTRYGCGSAWYSPPATNWRPPG